MTLHELLSTHSQNALRKHFQRPDILNRPQEIADLGPRQIACAAGVGVATMKKIALALYELGTIKRNDAWLKPYLDELT